MDLRVIYQEARVIDLDAYLRARRDALLQEVRAIEKVLDIEPKEVAVCPSCQKRWNRPTGGG